MKDLDSKAWRAFHKIGQQLLPHLGRQVTSHSGLTPAEYVVLLSVFESQAETINLNNLANQLCWEISRMSHQVSRMHESGLLNKVKSRTDSRCFNVSLTSRGRKHISDAIPLQSIEVNHCFSDILSISQKQALIEISQVICNHLETLHPVSQRNTTQKAS